MASRVNDVSNSRSLLVTSLEKLSSLSSKLSDLLVQSGLFLKQLRRVALGLLDSTNLLLKQVDLATDALLVVLDCQSAADSIEYCIPLHDRKDCSRLGLILRTLFVLVEELEHLINNLDLRASLLLRLHNDVKVASFFGLDWIFST